MAARKNRPVLYEVIHRSRQREPGRLTRFLTQASEPAPEVTPEPAPIPERTVSVATTPHPAAGSAVEFRGDKLHVTLGWISGLAVVIALLLLLWVAYNAGQRSAATAAPPESNQPAPPGGTASVGRPEYSPPAPGGNLPEPERIAVPIRPAVTERAVAAEASAPPTNETAAPSVLPKGHHYLVVQDFTVQTNRGLRERDAAAAVEHLRKKGIEAVIVRPPGKAPLVVVTQSVDGLTEQQLAALQARIREAGKDFPDYTFKDPYVTSF